MSLRTETQPLAVNHFLGRDPTGLLQGVKLRIETLLHLNVLPTVLLKLHVQATHSGASEDADSGLAGSGNETVLPKAGGVPGPGITVSGAEFSETSIKELILTDQVGRERRELLLCRHVT